MPELKQRMCLYHGSYCAVQEPDLSKCARFKDFGQGFYLTTSKEQAENFAKISTRKAIAKKLIPPQDFGVVSTYICVDPSELLHLEYPAADANWLHCVVAHRRNRYFPELLRQITGYDVVSGKIANDDTNITITAYLDGLYGEIGTQGADRICISLLLPDRLKDQYCFRTDKALKTLIFKGSEQVW